MAGLIITDFQGFLHKTVMRKFGGTSIKNQLLVSYALLFRLSSGAPGDLAAVPAQYLYIHDYTCISMMRRGQTLASPGQVSTKAPSGFRDLPGVCGHMKRFKFKSNHQALWQYTGGSAR